MKRLVLLFGLVSSPLMAVTGDVVFKIDTNLPKMDADGKCSVNGGELKDGKLSGKFTVNIKECDTGNGIRNDHLQKRFKDSTITLDLQPVVAAGSRQFKANLTINGVTKPAEGKITFYANKTAKAEFLVNYTFFNIKEVKEMGAKVHAVVPISVTLKL